MGNNKNNIEKTSGTSNNKSNGSVNIGKNIEADKELDSINNNEEFETSKNDYSDFNVSKSKKLESRNGIKLNRKMRMWNKYKNLCFICVGAAAAVVICIAGYKTITSTKSDAGENKSATTETVANNTTQTTVAQNVTQSSDNQNNQNNQNNQTTQATDNAQNNNNTTTQQTTQSTIQETTLSPNMGFSPLSIVGPAVAQEYTSREYYNGSIFIGDSIMDGIAYYKYIDTPQVMADGNNTTDKADRYIETAVNLKPAKVFIMVGLNDVNYGTRSAQTIAENIMWIATQIKTASPTTNVYVLSLLPITQAFEAKANVNAKQSVIDEVNNIVMSACQPNSVTYIDVATAFKDNTGYMNPQYTGNGSNIYNEYYPFLLNSIAGVVK